jgi:hypothetical protein
MRRRIFVAAAVALGATALLLFQMRSHFFRDDLEFWMAAKGLSASERLMRTLREIGVDTPADVLDLTAEVIVPPLRCPLRSLAAAVAFAGDCKDRDARIFSSRNCEAPEVEARCGRTASRAARTVRRRGVRCG